MRHHPRSPRKHTTTGAEHLNLRAHAPCAGMIYPFKHTVTHSHATNLSITNAHQNPPTTTTPATGAASAPKSSPKPRNGAIAFLQPLRLREPLRPLGRTVEKNAFVALFLALRTARERRLANPRPPLERRDIVMLRGLLDNRNEDEVGNDIVDVLQGPGNKIRETMGRFKLQTKPFPLRGYNELCTIDLAIRNQPTCPHPLCSTNGCLPHTVFNVHYGTPPVASAP
ncbi:hypothetical protein VTI74DRAFT_3510 [Chaetomium olivicolor]